MTRGAHGREVIIPGTGVQDQQAGLLVIAAALVLARVIQGRKIHRLLAEEYSFCQEQEWPLRRITSSHG